MSWLGAAGLLVASPLLLLLTVVVGYRWIFSLAFLAARRQPGGSTPASAVVDFGVLIPAHDEEFAIQETIESIRGAAYPSHLITIYVVCDNCSDRTALVSQRHGATVLERCEPDDPGKGQALAWGLARLDLERHDAIAFVDADCHVDPKFFRAMGAELAAGARILQGYDGVANPSDSPLTRIMEVTSVMKNLLFYGGKRALGMSCHLMGTGMVFATGALRARPWSAHSLAEDLEQSLELRVAGEEIRYVPDAQVRAVEAVSLGEGFAQRTRWAGGRRALRRRAWRAAAMALRARRGGLLDGAVELLLPTYSMSVNLTLAAIGLSLLAWPAYEAPLALAGSLLGLELLEVGVALVVMRADRRFLLSLFFSPVFLVWKAAIDISVGLGRGPRRWIRARRHWE